MFHFTMTCADVCWQPERFNKAADVMARLLHQ